MRKCIKCSSFKEEELFKSKNICKECNAKYEQIYRLDNVDKIKSKQQRWADNNRERYRDILRQHRADNKEHLREQSKTRLKTDILYRIKRNLRTRLSCMIKRGQKGGSAVRDLGCSITDFKLYMESLFQLGMTWDNWSRTGWHIDHIKPLSSFNLSDPVQVKLACHYTNLQPLWAIDNLKKSNKYSG